MTAVLQLQVRAFFGIKPLVTALQHIATAGVLI